jgi:hypothetical protein
MWSVRKKRANRVRVRSKQTFSHGTPRSTNVPRFLAFKFEVPSTVLFAFFSGYTGFLAADMIVTHDFSR